MTKDATTNNTPVASEKSPEANGRFGLLTFKKSHKFFFWIIQAVMLNNMVQILGKLPCQFQCQTADSVQLHKCSCIKQRLKPV
jgi:hypothetical protein